MGAAGVTVRIADAWHESKWWRVLHHPYELMSIRIEYTNGFAIRFDDVRIEPLALPIPSELLPSDRIPIARLLPRATLALVEGTPEPRSAKLLKSLRK